MEYDVLSGKPHCGTDIMREQSSTSATSCGLVQNMWCYCGLWPLIL